VHSNSPVPRRTPVRLRAVAEEQASSSCTRRKRCPSADGIVPEPHEIEVGVRQHSTCTISHPQLRRCLFSCNCHMTAPLLDSDLPTLQGHRRRPSLPYPLPSVHQHHGGLSSLSSSPLPGRHRYPSVLHPGLTDPGVQESQKGLHWPKQNRASERARSTGGSRNAPKGRS
jgi:hypothetical protein